jgi:hypothetical protein
MAPTTTTARAELDAHEALPLDEQTELGHAHLQRLRRAAFREHTARMPELAEWATKMAEKHGQHAVVHGNVLGWAEAYMVARFGEAMYHWPDALSELEVQRMAEVLDGRGRALGGGDMIQPLGDPATARKRFAGRTLHADAELREQLRAHAAPAAAGGETSNEGPR